MSQNNQYLATLIGSRICHDLISPVGAIQNGIELLSMEGMGSPEMTLIEESVANASARIRFMRVAFGLAGTGQNISDAEIRTVLDDVGRSGRVRYDWSAGGDCPRPAAQAMFLAFLCFESAMPRGGRVLAARDGEGWVISGPADTSRPDPALWTHLCGGPAVEGVMPAHVQFPLLATVLQGQGTRAELARDGETVTLRFAI